MKIARWSAQGYLLLREIGAGLISEGRRMNKQRMKSTLIAAVFVAVVSGGSSGPPAAAMARQFVVLATAGDPGDAFGAEPGGGGCCDPTDGLDGDPADGEGRSLLAGGQAGREDASVSQSDPCDGEEAHAVADSESKWWRKWLDLVAVFTGAVLGPR